MKRAQLIAMIRYELKMQWRRRELPMFMVTLVLGLLLTALGVQSLSLEMMTDLDITLDASRMQSTVSVMYGWTVVLLLLILAVPLIVAETIPKDRQVGVRELLDSLPLSLAVYLTGKLLSVWTGMLVGLTGVAVLYGLEGWLIHGPYELGMYLVLWMVGIAPLALFTSGMSTLLPAGQPSRRRAIVVGVAFAAYCVAMMATTSGTIEDVVSLARPSVFFILHGLAGFTPQDVFSLGVLADIGLISYPSTQIPLTIGMGALQVALVWLIVWAWTKWKESV